MAELIYESVIVALNKAIKIDPKNVGRYKMLAEVYEKSGRLDEARTAFEKVLDIWENIGSVYRYRGEDGKIVTGWGMIDGNW